MTAFRSLQKALKKRNDLSLKNIKKAYDVAKKAHGNQYRKDGTGYITHPVAVAEILLEIDADEATLIAALLHDTIEDTEITSKEITKEFGKEICHMVEAVTKLSKKEYLGDYEEHKRESFRKMLLMGADDKRALVIKIADRIHNMRTLSGHNNPDKQKRIAYETREIYVPLARELGVWQYKNELESLCLKNTDQNGFQKIQEGITALKKEKQNIVQKVYTNLRNTSAQSMLQSVEAVQRGFFHLEGKKHPFVFEETYLIRIEVKTEDDCYLIQRNIHALWRTIRGTESDSIGHPKENGYRAYHIKVLTETGEPLSLVIVTPEMREQNQKGNFFHNNNNGHSDDFLKSVHDLSQSTQKSKDFFEAAKTDILEEKIVIFVQNKEVTVPQGSTVLDALFSAYGDKALYTIKVRKNRKECRLGEVLKEDDIITAVFGKKTTAKFSWLYEVQTAQGRIAVQKFLHSQDRNQQITLGQRILQREFDFYGKGLVERHLQKCAGEIREKFGTSSQEDLFLLISGGNIKAYEVLSACFPQEKNGSLNWFLRKIKTFLHFRKEPSRRLHFKIIGMSEKIKTPVRWLSELCEETDVRILQSVVLEDAKARIFSLRVTLKAKQERDFHEVGMRILNYPGILRITPLLSPRNQGIFLGWLGGTLLMWILFPFLIEWTESLSLAQSILLYSSLIPVFVVNYLLFSFVTNYFVELRNTKWVLFTGFFLNFIASLILIFFLFSYKHLTNLLIPLVLLLITFLFLALRYTPHNTGKTSFLFLQTITWKEHIRQKIIGYVFRIGAILFFGAVPVVIKYFLSDIPNGLAITSLGALSALLFLSPLLLYKIARKQWGKKESYSLHFWLILLFEVLFFISYFFSVHFTSASSASLLLTLGPVIAIIFALLFLKEKVPYLQTKKHVRAIVLIFILGAFGASLLVMSKGVSVAGAPTGNKIFGDSLAVLAVLFDVIATIFLVSYAKSQHAFAGLDYILRKIIFLALVLSPISIYTIFHHAFSPKEVMGILFVGVGYFVLGFGFAYEAFRRLDGFINYLLMNVGQLFTVVLEVWFFDLPITFYFIWGTIFILSSSIAAEYLNTKCERAMIKLEPGTK